MFKHGPASKVAAVATIIALQLIAIPSLAQPGAVLDGTVLRADRATPIAGAKIHLANARTGELVGSAPTADDGSFHLDSLPGSEYSIAVEVDGGLYVVPAPLTLNDGETRRVHLAIQPNAQLDADSSVGASKLSFRNNPLTATLLLLGGLIILGLAIDELTDSDSASPFFPS